MIQVTRSYHINGSDRLAVFRNKRWLHTYRILTSPPRFTHRYLNKSEVEPARIVIAELNLSGITIHSQPLDTPVNDTYPNACAQVEHTAFARSNIRGVGRP